MAGRAPAGGHGKKLIARDPLLDLAAFYAPRGIPPAAVLAMSPAERLTLRVSRTRYYEELIALIQQGVAAAFTPPEREEGTDGEK